MRRFSLDKFISVLALICVMGACLCACGANAPEAAISDTVPPAVTEVPAAETPEPEGVPETLTLPAPADGWAESYLRFLDDNYDIFAALWPDGVSGIGFIDLDLDSTPELLVFDQGASATLGAQLFDLVDGQVYCVSSTLADSAAGAFDGTYLTDVAINTSYFESFRLSRTEEGWCFWVDSANSTMEAAWDEIVRFDCVDGVLTPAVVCARYLESDPETGLVVTEEYSIDGQDVEQPEYQAAAEVLFNGEDMGYEAQGVFLWNDMETYGTTYEGYTAMAEAAVEAYAPIADSVTRVSVAE